MLLSFAQYPLKCTLCMWKSSCKKEMITNTWAACPPFPFTHFQQHAQFSLLYTHTCTCTYYWTRLPLPPSYAARNSKLTNGLPKGKTQGQTTCTIITPHSDSVDPHQRNLIVAFQAWSHPCLTARMQPSSACTGKLRHRTFQHHVQARFN